MNKEGPYELVPVLGEPFRRYLDLVYQDVYGSKDRLLTPEERREAADYVLDFWDNGQKNPEDLKSPQEKEH